MRIGMALVIFTDLIIRSTDLKALYTDEGLLPLQIAQNFGWKDGYWSLYLINGSYAWAAILFGLHFIFTFFLLIGYRTRISTVILLVLYISLHNRNVFVNQAGDDLLRLVLLWGILLPWQAHYSWDSRHQPKVPPQFTVANIAYLFLLSSVYFFAAILKTGSEWHGDGTAIYYALSLDQLRLPVFGDWLYQFPALMKVCTWIALTIEFLIPVLLLWPSKKGTLRGLSFFLLVFLHVGIGLTLYVGLFFIIGMVSALGLLPARSMDWLEQRTGLAKKTIPDQAVASTYKFIVNSLSALLIIVCLILNFSSATWFGYQLKPQILKPVNVLRLDQFWGMFSPTVLKKDGWFVYYGVDSIGRQWDLRRNEDYVDFEKPEHVVSMYNSDRWRKLAENMQGTSVFLRPLYCKHVLKKWNAEHPEKKLSTLNLYFMQKENLADYKTTNLTKNLYCVCIDD